MRHTTALLFAFTVAAFSSEAVAQNGRFDARLTLFEIDLSTGTSFVDVEIKASSPSEEFALAALDFRFDFNIDAIPPIAPPITSPNPTDRTVGIEQELDISGLISGTGPEGTSFAVYDEHSLSGSTHDFVSLGVVLGGGTGITIRHDAWSKVTRLRLDTIPGSTPTLHVRSNSEFPPTVASEQIGQLTFVQVAEGTFHDLTFQVPDCDVPGMVTTCSPGHHAFGGPLLDFEGSAPRLGETLAMTGTNLSGSLLSGLMVGTGSAPVPLSLIGSLVPNSMLCIQPWATIPTTGGNSSTVALDILADPLFCGFTFDVQWIDYAGMGMDFGTSRAVHLTVGY